MCIQCMSLILITLTLACQANGLDERWNQTLKNIIVKYVSSRKELWDEYLDACVFAYVADTIVIRT